MILAAAASGGKSWTGTLGVDAQGRYSYSSTPTDRLQFDLGNGQAGALVLKKFDPGFTMNPDAMKEMTDKEVSEYLQRHVTKYPEETHHLLFQLKMEGGVDCEVESFNKMGGASYQVVKGTLVAQYGNEVEQMNVAILDGYGLDEILGGTVEGRIDSNVGAWSVGEARRAGTIVSGDETMNIDERIETNSSSVASTDGFYSFSSYSEQLRKYGTSWSKGKDLYELQDAWVKVVSSSDGYTSLRTAEGGGRVLKNGSLVGELVSRMEKENNNDVHRVYVQLPDGEGRVW
jgi:hypothetical protein